MCKRPNVSLLYFKLSVDLNVDQQHYIREFLVPCHRVFLRCVCLERERDVAVETVLSCICSCVASICRVCRLCTKPPSSIAIDVEASHRGHPP